MTRELGLIFLFFHFHFYECVTALYPPISGLLAAIMFITVIILSNRPILEAQCNAIPELRQRKGVILIV